MLSIFLTLCGLYSIATARAPLPLMGGRRGQPDAAMRVAGIALALAFPLSLALRMALPMAAGETALMFAPAVEIAISLAALVAAFALGRRPHHTA